MVFVDTGAVVALLDPRDQSHKPAKDWVLNNEQVPRITTDFILDEIYTLLMVKLGKEHAANILQAFINSGWLSQIEFVSEADFWDAEKIFMKYKDKEWSFTDCTSKVVMERLKIDTAFAFDNHFRQFASCIVEP